MASKIKSIRDIPTEEQITSGTSLCAGCGGILLVRMFEKVLGSNVITLNAAGCLSLSAVFPYTPFKSSWFYIAMASAPAAAQGVRDALDILIKKGKITKKEDLKVVVVTGDGAASDIGLSSTSGALHRGLDFYYLVYDNEAYANTGFQASGSSPYASATKTTVPTESMPAGNLFTKKDLFEIWRAHKPPYIATVSPAYMNDLVRKIARSQEFEGPKLFIAHSPCQPGWDISSSQVIRLAKLAVETGAWPLKEAVYGSVTHNIVPKPRRPIEEYLKLQGRFEHLFEPKRQEEVLQELQRRVDEYWENVK